MALSTKIETNKFKKNANETRQYNIQIHLFKYRTKQIKPTKRNK